MDKKVLGRGINALIPEREREQKVESGSADILRLNLAQIRPNPLQPREYFDDQSLQELTQSIKEKGIIQPVLVRRRGDYYELIAGERRFRAANMLQLKEIPAIIKDVEDEDSLELSLIENIQRQDLNPIEEAHAYKHLIDKFHLSQERLSEVLGKARTTIANMLRLLNLPHEIQEEMRKGRISFAHGRALLELDDANQQRRLLQEIISKSLSVRELENLLKTKRPRLAKSKVRQGSGDPYVSAVEEQLQHILATKVRVNKQKKRGRIVIEFYSQEDLERIVNRIRGGDTT
jgi:ParB family chromosome partitioning protein